MQSDGGPVEELGPGATVTFGPGERHWHGSAPRPPHGPVGPPGRRRQRNRGRLGERVPGRSVLGSRGPWRSERTRRCRWWHGDPTGITDKYEPVTCCLRAGARVRRGAPPATRPSYRGRPARATDHGRESIVTATPPASTSAHASQATPEAPAPTSKPPKARQVEFPRFGRSRCPRNRGNSIPGNARDPALPVHTAGLVAGHEPLLAGLRAMLPP